MTGHLTPRSFAWFKGDDDQYLECHFNPSDVTMTMKTGLADEPLVGGDSGGGGLTYKGRATDQLKITLLFDDQEVLQREQGWVTADTIRIFRSWTEVELDDMPSAETRQGATNSPSGQRTTDPQQPDPPKVTFKWGDADPFVGAISNLVVKYLRVNDRGMPIRAQITVTLRKWKEDTENQNPTSGGASGRRAAVLVDGDSLASLAFKHYKRADLWRGIALENGIEDPYRLVSGTRLLIPTKARAEALCARGGER